VSALPVNWNIQIRAGGAEQGVRPIRSYVIRCTNMASQAFSASANVLKGDPPTLMAGLFKLMGRQEATKPGFPWSPGPLLLSLLITNEKPRSLALHISSSCVAGAMRLKCMGAFDGDGKSYMTRRFSVSTVPTLSCNFFPALRRLS
jgi:hypothetical protein